MKDALYQVKKYLLALYVYPKSTISDLPDTNYDEYWQARASNVGGGLNAWQAERADIIASHFKERGNINVVLDVGCGNGDILKRIDDRVRINKKVGVDVSDIALELARKQDIETFNQDVSMDQSIFSKIQDLDVVLFLEVLEHMTNPEKVLREAMSNANVGVLYSIPNTGFFTHRFRLFFGKVPMQWRVHPSEHVRFWTIADTRWWLRAMGYSNFEIIPYQGVPVLNKIFPSLFAAGILVFVKQND